MNCTVLYDLLYVPKNMQDLLYYYLRLLFTVVISF